LVVVLVIAIAYLLFRTNESDVEKHITQMQRDFDSQI
jgi:hypothetical protein